MKSKSCIMIKTVEDVKNQVPLTAQKKPIKITAWCMKEDFQVHTLEGVMSGVAGDYVIEGIQGELYPCKKDIFEATYDPSPVECKTSFCPFCGSLGLLLKGSSDMPEMLVCGTCTATWHLL